MMKKYIYHYCTMKNNGANGIQYTDGIVETTYRVNTAKRWNLLYDTILSGLGEDVIVVSVTLL